MANDPPLLTLKAAQFTLQTSVLGGGIRYSKSAVYNQEVIINRSGPVVIYSHGGPLTFSLALQLVAMENAKSEVEDVLTALYSLVHAATQAGVDPPNIVYVTAGENQVLKSMPCVVTNVDPHWGDTQSWDGGASMTAMVNLSFLGLELTNKSANDYKGQSNFLQLSFPGSGG